MSSNKGIVYDGFSDYWIKNCKNPNILNNVWTPKFVNAIGDHLFEARLIPLNKEYPEIPKADKFRPITVLSPMYKWMSLRFYLKIRDYIKNRLDSN